MNVNNKPHLWLHLSCSAWNPLQNWVWCFVCLASADLLRPVCLQCPLCQRAEHFSQWAHPHPGVPRHDRQQRVVAWPNRWGAPRLCALQLHPQSRVHLNTPCPPPNTHRHTDTDPSPHPEISHLDPVYGLLSAHGCDGQTHTPLLLALCPAKASETGPLWGNHIEGLVKGGHTVSPQEPQRTGGRLWWCLIFLSWYFFPLLVQNYGQLYAGVNAE